MGACFGSNVRCWWLEIDYITLSYNFRSTGVDAACVAVSNWLSFVRFYHIVIHFLYRQSKSAVKSDAHSKDPPLKTAPKDHFDLSQHDDLQSRASMRRFVHSMSWTHCIIFRNTCHLCALREAEANAAGGLLAPKARRGTSFLLWLHSLHTFMRNHECCQHVATAI